MIKIVTNYGKSFLILWSIFIDFIARYNFDKLCHIYWNWYWT